MLASETGKARLPTVDRRTGGTARRWEAEDRNRCLDVMSARRVKHDCRYPGTVPLQISYYKFEIGIEKKLRLRRYFVEKSQSKSKKFDAIDVRLYGYMSK